MKWAALVTWVLTAGGGLAMLGLWLKHGGMRDAARGGQRIRPPVILTHFALAAGGLVVWIIYLAADRDALAWAALAVLAVVAALGFTMLAIWLRRRGRQPAMTSAGTSGGPEPAEQRFPPAIVTLHGILAAATLVLVLLTAAGVGGS